MIAALPMYDWPEVRPDTDRLWAALRDAFRADGIEAPEALARDRAAAEVWRASDLVLAQTCGLPYVRELAARVTLLGAPDHAVPGCLPGYYRSAIIVRAGDRRDRLAAFRGATFAYNEPTSQSGVAAMMHHVGPLARDGRFFGATLRTGAHRDAAAAVAAGAADIAAIDCVSWRLIRRFRAEAAGLRVLRLTDPTPGLPYVTARGRPTERLRAAVGRAIAGLDAGTRSRLGLAGFQPFEPAAYAVLARRADAAPPLAA